MLTEMKDFLGRPVMVGDHIFYSTTGRYAESRLAVVTRFTAKSMFVRVVKRNRIERITDEEHVVRNDFVKVEVPS